MAENGDLIGRYRVEELIAEGGMSKVYKVKDMRIGIIRAMKEIEQTDDVICAAYKETRILKSVNFPSLPGITDIVRTEDSYCVVMDYIEGKTIRDIVKENGKFSEKEAARISRCILNTLIYLHGRNPPIIYRDLKPSNVMITTEGDVKMIDFGISQISGIYSENNRFITREFAAPETIIEGICDEKSDIYCFGCTLKYMLPERMSLGMKYFISICTSHNPKDRFESAKDALEALNKNELFNVGFEEKLKRKIGKTFFFTIMFFMSAAGLFLSEQYEVKMKITERESLVREALESFDSEKRKVKLEELILSEKDETWYLKYLEEIKGDTVFDETEAEKIESIIERDEEVLKENNLYFEIAENIGELYMFYYQDDANGNEKYRRAAIWFDKCKESNEESRIYADICHFLSDIRPMILEGKDGGMYAKFYNGIENLIYKDYGEDIYSQMLIYELAVDSVYAYGSDFYREGIKADDMRDMLKSISGYVNEEKDYGSNGEKIREKILKRIKEAVFEIDYIEGNFNG